MSVNAKFMILVFFAIALIAWSVGSNTKHCESMLRQARTHSDSLVVATSGRCDYTIKLEER